MTRRLLTLACLLSTFSAPAVAQNYIYDTGSPVYSTSLPTDRGVVNVNNGEIHLEIPIAVFPQRGNLNLTEKLVYDSRIWHIVDNGGTLSWQPNNLPNSSGGWSFSNGGGSGTFSYTEGSGNASNSPGCGNDNGGPTTRPFNDTSGWSWTDSSGTTHQFPSIATFLWGPNPYWCTGTPSPGPASSGGYASDGSGYFMSVTNFDVPVVTDLQGTTYHPTYAPGSGYSVPVSTSGNITDQYGNYFSQDSNGNTVGTNGVAPVLVTTSGNTTTYAVLNVGGQSRSNYQVTTTTVNFNTSFGELDTNEAQGSFSAVQSITLPDGSAYSFNYDSGTSAGHYGELTSMTLPTGGVVSYGWSNYLDSYNNVNRWLTGLGKDGGTTTFTPALISKCTSSAGCQESVTVQKPDGNATLYTFNLDKAGQIAGESWVQGIKSYQGSTSNGTLLRSTTSAYTYTGGQTCSFVNGPSEQCTGSAYEVATGIVATVSLDNGLTSQTSTAIDFSTGSTTETKVWEFGASTSGSPTTDTVYQGTTAFPTSVTVSDGSGNKISQTTYGYNEGSAPSSAPSGLSNFTPTSGTPHYQTSQHQWINTSGQTFDSTTTYDTAGFVLTHTDPNGKISYTPDSSDTFVATTTYPTPSSGASIAASTTTDLYTGAVQSTTDPNSQQTTYSSFDNFNRPHAASYPDGGSSTFSYSSETQSGIQRAIDSRASDTEMLVDGYGRPNRKAVGNGQSSNPWFQTDTCYNTTGEMSFVSNSYAGPGFSTPPLCANGGNGSGGDAYSYDGLGRVTTIVHGDGSAQHFYYQGRAVESVDENGVTKITQTDAFGRITAVCEVTGATLMNSGSPASCGLDYAGTGYLTTYAYDNPNHKMTVVQGGQTRIFTTDSLGRTVSSQEPEVGTTSYTYAYNGTGLILTRNRPQANQKSASTLTTTTSQYDSLGRVVDIKYSDGLTPEKSYTYDVPPGGGSYPSGHLTGRLSQAATFFSGGTAATTFDYDPMGRVSQTNTCLPGKCNTTSIPIGYNYDHAGDLTAEGGPSIGTITSTYDIAGNLASKVVTPPSNSTATVLSNVQMGPFGPSSYQLGNGLYQVHQYDIDGVRDRGWICAGSNQPQCTSGTGIYGWGTSVKGSRLLNSSDSVLNTYNNYTYNDLNQLTGSSTGSGTPSLTWVYDRFGNRYQQNASGGGSAPQPQHSINTTNNQITDSSANYDAAGDTNYDGVNGFTYDAEGSVIAAANGSTSYLFDALGHRIEKIPSSGDATQYVYDAFGNELEIVDANTNALLTTRFYLQGAVIASLAAGGTLNFEHRDWLGTLRMLTNSSGAQIGNYSSFPYGDGYTYNGVDGDVMHFAVLDHDSLTNTDHADARDYDEGPGRWLSPDPSFSSYDWSDPQSLNRYSYVLNNPLSMTDPSGQCPLCFGWTYWAGDTLQVFSFAPNPVTLLGVGAALAALGIDELGKWLGWWGGPQFHGSLHPRPNAPNSIDCSQAPPAPPQAPPGANLAQNVTQASGMSQASWINHVREFGQWDYAHSAGQQFAAFGNFNYGATCATFFSLGGCQFGAGLAAYGSAAKNVLQGGKWTAGPGAPWSPVKVNGLQDYGDQSIPSENPSVVNGYNYEKWQEACHG